MRRTTLLAVGLGALAVAAAACAPNATQDTLQPAGPYAQKPYDLFVPVFWVATAIFVLVEGAIVVFSIRYRHRKGRDQIPPQVHGNTRLEIAWTILPALILAGIAVPTVTTIFDLAREPGEGTMQVDVLGHQWWWEFSYLDQGFTTANELHIPTGEPVYLRLCAVASAPNASEEDVDRAVRAARDAQPKWAALSAWDRAKICHAIAALIDERRETFARELSLEQGKPYTAEALPDIDETAENFRIAAEDVKRMETAIIPSQDVNKRILTFRKPNGVYAAITPWNFPTLIPVELIAPGIAAGNTLVVKPSEWTPVAMANFMQIMADAGLPEGVLNVVYGAGEVGERLVTHPGIDCIGFVGSHTTAEKIVRAAGLKRSLIEASGNGPVIVLDDADLARAAEGAVFGGFFCAGQVCCATERVLVHEKVHDAFLDEVVKAAASWKLGDPFDDETLVGPMNNEPTARKMDAHLEDAVAKGAEVVLGGSRDGGRPTSLYYQPTVVTGVDVDTLINREETFGPIVPLLRVSSDEEALAVANDSPLGLQAAVYTSSLKRAFTFLDNLQVGNVVVNDSTDYWEAHEPFGGASGTRTGWGRIGGRYTMLDMTDLKTVVLDVGTIS